MTQASLFQTADVLLEKPSIPSGENPLVDVIDQLIPRLQAFDGDINIRLNEDIDNSLYDIFLIKDGKKHLDDLIGMLSKISGHLQETAQKIIDEHAEENNLTDGTFEIFPKTKTSNRKLDLEKLKSEFKTDYNSLYKADLAEFKRKYKPTLKDVESKLKSEAVKVLIPGTTEITGYGFRFVGTEEAL